MYKGCLWAGGWGWRGRRASGGGGAGRVVLGAAFLRALAEWGRRLGYGGVGAVGGSAESSDAPWSSGPKELLASCARGARPGCAPTPHAAEWVLPRAPARAPSPAAEVARARPSAARGLLPRGEGAAAGWMSGVFCADPRARGACSRTGSGRTKRAALVGRAAREAASPDPPRVGVGAGSVARFWKE